MSKNVLQLASDLKYYLDYSRWIDDENRTETWEDSVDRVMNMHKIKYANFLNNPRFVELFKKAEGAYKDKLVLGSQRALQFGGEPILKHNARLYNCFDVETKFITSEGIRKFSDYNDGDIIKVLTHTGKWQRAVVRNYGKQHLNKVVIKRGRYIEKEVLVTGNHRWLLKNEQETTELSVGDKLLSSKDIFSEFNYDSADPIHKLYWCYGYVYGDGTKVKYNGEYTYSMVRLCGSDIKYKDRFEEMGFKTSSSTSLDGDFMVYTGKYLKTTPNPNIDSPQLIRAFVRGYLDADGTKNRNNYDSKNSFDYITSYNEDNQKFIEECFPIAGIHIVSKNDVFYDKTNFGKTDGAKIYRLINKFDRENKYSQSFKVDRIEENVKYCDVWCLEVENDRSFVLEGGLITGNCTATYVDRVRSFQEIMYLLLCGCGVGFSVQYKHISKLPNITKRTKGTKTFVVPDNIEGWSDAFGILISSYIEEGKETPFPEYQGYEIRFDLSLIRPEGAMISGGFKAPGPEGLRKSLLKAEELIERNLNQGVNTMKPIMAYDFIMFMADAVLSGGVRRSATICLFSPEDDEMMNAKVGNWYYENAQRARSNNSAVINRNTTTKEQFNKIFTSIKDFGEPGFYFVDDEDQVTNPCVEIGLYPQINGLSGFQGCNLTEGNGGMCTTEEKFYEACEALSILGTLQAGYADFPYLGEVTESIFRREALLGCSFTGWMANPHIMMNPEIQRKGAEIVKKVNQELAEIIGINPASRTTCVKPSGNASVLLKSPSGCHGDHAPRYFRVMQINKQSGIGKYLNEEHPYLIEESVWSANKTDYVAYIPVIANKNAKFKKDLVGMNQLEVVKTIQNNWVEYGTNHERNVQPYLRHSVSNTVELDYSDYDVVEDYLFNNRFDFAAVSFLPLTGDKDFNQAPFTSVLSGEELYNKYDDAAFFASGLIVDGLHAFDGNLWEACDYVNKRDLKLQGTRVEALIKKDWIRRAKQFAKRFFKGDIKEMVLCIKDLHLYHKWVRINRELKQRDFDFNTAIKQPEYVDMDTMGAASCSNGLCEITPEFLDAMRSNSN